MHQLGENIKTRQSPAYTHRAALSQTARTSSMLVNPYNAYDPLPRKCTLTPAVDRWTDVYDTLKSPTMIASFYGMNFDHMPELHWHFGYPVAMTVMLLGCLWLYRRLKRARWL